MLQDAKPAAKPLKRNKSTGILLPGPSLIPPAPPSTLKRQLSRKSLSKLDHPAAPEGAAEEEAGSEQVMGKCTTTTVDLYLQPQVGCKTMLRHLEWATSVNPPANLRKPTGAAISNGQPHSKPPFHCNAPAACAASHVAILPCSASL